MGCDAGRGVVTRSIPDQCTMQGASRKPDDLKVEVFNGALRLTWKNDTECVALLRPERAFAVHSLHRPQPKRIAAHQEQGAASKAASCHARPSRP